MRSASALLVSLLLWANISVAAPESQGPRVHLEVAPPSECASAAELVRGVRSRTPRVRFVDQSPELVVRVSFTEARSGEITGKLVMVRGDRTIPLRKLVARSCKDAADGVALILAITLDPAMPAQTGDPTDVVGKGDDAAEKSSESPRAEMGGPTTRGAPEQPTTAGEPSSSLRDRLPLLVRDEPGTTPESANSAPSDWDWRLGGDIAGEASFGLAPAIMPGVAAYLMLALERPSPWSPALLLGGIRAWSGDFVESYGTASFSLTALTLDACALRFEMRAFEGRGCASLLAGQLSVTGSNTLNPAGTVRLPFTSLGGLGMLSWRVGSRVQITGRLASRVSLIRDQFEFGPSVLHKVEAFTLSASVGLGVRWP